MPLNRRLLSVVLWALYETSTLRTLIGVIMLVVAFVRAVGTGWQAGLMWGLPAAFLLLAGAYADARGFMLFVPDDAVGVMEPTRPGIHKGLAGGRFVHRHWSGLLVWAEICSESVQVRWLSDERPPHLAVLQPPGMPENTFSPLEEAERFACWYPGSDVRVGWVAAAWDVYPGVQLQFIGKRMVLALPTEADARAVADALGPST